MKLPWTQIGNSLGSANKRKDRLDSHSVPGRGRRWSLYEKHMLRKFNPFLPTKAISHRLRRSIPFGVQTPEKELFPSFIRWQNPEP